MDYTNFVCYYHFKAPFSLTAFYCAIVCVVPGFVLYFTAWHFEDFYTSLLS